MIPSWGKIIIEENEARIHTHISTPDAASSEMLDFVTYMVNREDQWKVDFDQTDKVVQPVLLYQILLIVLPGWE